MSASSDYLNKLSGTTANNNTQTKSSPIVGSSSYLKALKSGGAEPLRYVPSSGYTPAPVPQPTLGSKVGNFVKGAVGDALNTLLVTPAARATSAVTQLVAPNSLAAKGFQMQQDEGQSQNFKFPIVGNVEVKAQKAFGQGGGEQIAGQALHSAAYLASYGKIADSIGGAALGSATKLTPQAIKTAKLIGNVGAGAVGGGTFGAGTSMEQGGSVSDVLKSTALNSVVGAALPAVIGGASRLLKGKTNIPTSTTSDIAPTLEKPIVKETAPTLTTTEPKLKETPQINNTVQTPESQAQVQRIVEQAKAEAPDPLKFESTTIADRTQKIQSQPLTHIDNVLNGTEKPIDGTTFADYWRVASDNAEASGDVVKQLELGLSKPKQIVGSKAGQELGAFSQIDKSSVPSLISQIFEERIGKLPGRIITNQSKEVSSISDTLKEIINTTRKNSNNSSDIVAALELIKCK